MALTILSSFIHTISPYIPPGLLLCVASAFIVGGKYLSFWRNEFIGTLLMVSFTFSAGKWVGIDSQNIAWLSHFIGVVAADYIGGGQHVNPAVSVSMWCLGKCDYTEMYVRIAGQMGGGLVAFPIFHLLSETLGWTPFGGPDFDKTEDEQGVGAAFNELVATMLLCFVIYAVNWEIHFGQYHYWIKQSLTALGIRYLIEMFPKSGPAMNPMLGTTWAVFAADENIFPPETSHYVVYWLGSILGGLVASLVYAIYSGNTFFGATLPVGPIKAQPATASAAATSAPSKKKKK